MYILYPPRSAVTAGCHHSKSGLGEHPSFDSTSIMKCTTGLNDFEAHIIAIEEGKAFPSRSQIIKEYGSKVDRATSTASCYIPVTAGTYFAAWWWAKGQKNVDAYSAEFRRDGESVVHLVFSSEDAAHSAGIAGDWYDEETCQRWNFQFRNMNCTGL